MEKSLRPNFFRLASIKPSKSDKTEDSEETLTKDSGIPYKLIRVFFKKLQKSISNQGDFKSIAKKTFNEDAVYTLPQFTEKIINLDRSISIQQIEHIYLYLSKNNVLSGSKFLKELKTHKDLSDSSDESSDISSGDETEFTKEEINIEKVSEIFEVLSFKMYYLKISSEVFVETVEKYFNDFVTSDKLNRFLLLTEYRIEDGPERNMLISFIIQNKEKIPVHEVIQIFIERCFAYRINIIENFIQENIKSNLIESCKRVDFRKTGYLTWSQLSSIFKEFGVDTGRDTRFFCYRLQKSLDLIPYNYL